MGGFPVRRVCSLCTPHGTRMRMNSVTAGPLFSVRISNPQALADLAHTSPVEAGYAALEEAECHEPAAPAPWLSSLVMLLCEDSGAG